MARRCVGYPTVFNKGNTRRACVGTALSFPLPLTGSSHDARRWHPQKWCDFRRAAPGRGNLGNKVSSYVLFPVPLAIRAQIIYLAALIAKSNISKDELPTKKLTAASCRCGGHIYKPCASCASLLFNLPIFYTARTTGIFKPPDMRRRAAEMSSIDRL